MRSEDELREQLFKIRQLLEHVRLDPDDEAPWLLQAEGILSWILGENAMGLTLHDPSYNVEVPSSPLDAGTTVTTRRVFKKNGRLRESYVQNPDLCRCGWATAEALERSMA